MTHQTVAEAIGAWKEFYTFTGGVSAPLLGLLFVALSVRLNVFHQREVADVRGFALLTFGCFVWVMLIAGLFLVPDQGRLGLAVPLLVLGLLGATGFLYVARLSLRLNQGAIRPDRGLWLLIVLPLLAHTGLVVVACFLLADQSGILPWLAAVCALLLVVASVNVWILLSHASPGQV